MRPLYSSFINNILYIIRVFILLRIILPSYTPLIYPHIFTTCICHNLKNIPRDKKKKKYVLHF